MAFSVLFCPVFVRLEKKFNILCILKLYDYFFIPEIPCYVEQISVQIQKW